MVLRLRLLLPFADEFNTLVCRASRGTQQANLGLMAYRTYMKTAISQNIWVNWDSNPEPTD